MGESQKKATEEPAIPEPVENGVGDAESPKGSSSPSRVRRNLETAKKLDEHHRRREEDGGEENDATSGGGKEARRTSTSSYIDGLRGKILEHIDVEEEADRENLHAARAYVNWVTLAPGTHGPM